MKNANELGIKVFEKELRAVEGLRPLIESESFAQAVSLILKCKGRVILTGMGKSGIIAHKISATMSSTGTPSFFLHPAESFHGDLGMIQPGELVIMLSHSGKTSEVVNLIPSIRALGGKIIGITGNPESPLAQQADVALVYRIEKEADHLNLAPTASTTAALVIGDCLAITVSQLKGFTENDFAFVHPGGLLGKLLCAKVDDFMHVGEENPVAPQSATFKEILSIVTSKRLGAVSIVDEEGKLVGIITDGDIRRLIERAEEEKLRDFLSQKAAEIMTENPKFLYKGSSAKEAFIKMETNKITVLPIVDEHLRPVGMVHLHDLLKEGIGRRGEDNEHA